jgi:gamma-glutamylputrescine oxidase
MTARDETAGPVTWYEATANPRPACPPLAGEREADVCIVGGGLTGLSAALELAGRGYCSVLLEAGRIGGGASGRNGGQVNTGMRCGAAALVDRFGLAEAKRMWSLAQEAHALIGERIAKYRIDCQRRPGTLYGSLRANYRAEVEREVDAMERHFGYRQARAVDRDDIRQLLATEVYHGGMVDRGASHLHPLNYAIGLAHAAIAAGATIHERSRARAVDADGHGVSTENGRIRARHTIVACNAYLGNLVPELAPKILPIKNYVIATEPLGAARARELNRDDLAVHDSRFVIDYYRMTHDHRLLFGGGEVYGNRDPTDIRSFVRKYALEVYPQLADARIDYGWGGWLALTVNRLPHMGRLSRDLYFAHGYSGQGVALSGLYGKLIAEAIAGTAERFDLFAAIRHRDFPGGALLRHPLQVLGMLWYSLRDRL